MGGRKRNWSPSGKQLPFLGLIELGKILADTSNLPFFKTMKLFEMIPCRSFRVGPSTSVIGALLT